MRSAGVSVARRSPRVLTELRARATDFVDVGGAGPAAVLVLFGLNMADEFDRLAFSTLTPEIRDAFGLSDQGIVAIASLSAAFVLLSAIPVGVFADRVSRVGLARLAAVIWTVMVVLTGMAWSIPVLLFSRFFAGVARSSNDIVHTGLLADYYEPRVHPKVFRLHRLANPLSLVAGLFVGALALVLEWRYVFVILALPTFVLLWPLARLSEPDRGASVDAEAARAAAVAVRSHRRSFRATSAEILRIRSLRRLIVGFAMFGIGAMALVQMVSLFFEDVYGFGPFGRGFVSFIYGAGLTFGILAGGRIGARYTRAGNHPALVSIAAASFFVLAVGTALMAIAPTAPLSIAAAFVASAGAAVILPTFPALLMRILPPHIRAQGQAFTTIAIAVGALAAIPIAALGERDGYRVAMLIIALVMIVSVPVVNSARRFVSEDVQSADASLRDLQQRAGQPR